MAATALTSEDPRSAGSLKSKPLLLVHHGSGRGRKTTFLPLLLTGIEKWQPELRKLLHLHPTGEPAPPLSDFGAVLFFLGDPIDCYPGCAAEARAIAKTARSLGLPVLNSPRGLSHTSKSQQSLIWQSCGLPCATARPAGSEQLLRGMLPGLSYPAIIRIDKGHTQRGMFLCRSMDEAEKHLDELLYPAVALEFIDTRQMWRETHPDSIMASFFHKKRAMVFPGSVFNNHIFFSEDPIVGSRTSTFAAAAMGLPSPRIDEMIRADIRYSLSPPELPRVMRAAVRALGLDFAAIDYSSLPDGRIILWEANPYFDLPSRSKSLLSSERKLKWRNPRYFDAFARDLARLAGYDIAE